MSDHERQKEQHAAGGGGGASGFDSGRTWGAAVPKVIKGWSLTSTHCSPFHA